MYQLLLILSLSKEHIIASEAADQPALNLPNN